MYHTATTHPSSLDCASDVVGSSVTALSVSLSPLTIDPSPIASYDVMVRVSDDFVG